MAAHVDKPLEADQRLHHGVAPLAVAHRVSQVLHPFQQTQAFQLGNHRLPGLKPFHPGVFAGGGGHVAVQANDGEDFQALALPYLKVHRVMAWCDLQGSGAEFRLDRLVGYHRNGAVHDGKNYL